MNPRLNTTYGTHRNGWKGPVRFGSRGRTRPAAAGRGLGHSRLGTDAAVNGLWGRHGRWRRGIVALVTATAAFLVSLVVACRVEAAFAEIPGLGPGDEEEIAARLRQEGELSLAEKIRVGRERYEQRLALKRALSQDLRARLELYRIETGRAQAMESPQNRPQDASLSASSGMPMWGWYLTGLLGVLSLWLIHRTRRGAASASYLL